MLSCYAHCGDVVVTMPDATGARSHDDWSSSATPNLMPVQGHPTMDARDHVLSDRLLPVLFLCHFVTDKHELLHRRALWGDYVCPRHLK